MDETQQHGQRVHDREEVESVALVAGHTLEIARRGGSNEICLSGASGGQLRIVVDERGVSLLIDGRDLNIRTTGNLALHAETLCLHAERKLALTSGADAVVRVAGELELQADAQRMVARRGDVTIEANDDVRVDAERIFLNS